MVDLSKFIEIVFNEPDDFLKVRETLTRIGVSSRKEKVLYQSCHILHKQGQYYVVHFKELFALDGKPSNISEKEDWQGIFDLHQKKPSYYNAEFLSKKYNMPVERINDILSRMADHSFRQFNMDVADRKSVV
jgi:hypothetical protein